MNELTDTAVIVEGVSKTFKLPHEKQSSVKGLFVNIFRRRKSFEKQHVLKNISFEVESGEFFGIVGRNGSGKSTLLKILAGIYAPNKGRTQVNGKLTPFIELGVGFNPELSGRENVYLNGALLGIGRKEVNSLYKEIVEFAELENFMDQKLKNYSSGMQVRLAFSIAIRAKGDILLLDEVLAVGDSAFQQKCYDYFHELKAQNKTIILVTHSMSTVEQFCDRALLLEQGEIKKIGPSSEIAELYEVMFRKEEVARLNASGDQDAVDDPIILHSIKILQGDRSKTNIQAFRPFEVELVIESKINYPATYIGVNIKNRDKVLLISSDTMVVLDRMVELKKGKKYKVRFHIQNQLTNGVYTVSLGVADSSAEHHKLVYKREGAIRFAVSGVTSHANTLTHPDITGEVSNIK